LHENTEIAETTSNSIVASGFKVGIDGVFHWRVERTHKSPVNMRSCRFLIRTGPAVVSGQLVVVKLWDRGPSWMLKFPNNILIQEDFYHIFKWVK